MIRLQRIGRTNDPSFRVVLTDRRNSPKSRNFVELLGTYNVQAGKTAFNAERIKHWISKGAKLSPTMHNFMVHEKIIAGKKINVLPRKSPVKKEGEGVPAESAAPAAQAVAGPVAEATATE
ncbi:MAG: 30S ribosomal protein S16 [Patescibacteria group bacterium]